MSPSKKFKRLEGILNLSRKLKDKRVRQYFMKKFVNSSSIVKNLFVNPLNLKFPKINNTILSNTFSIEKLKD